MWLAVAVVLGLLLFARVYIHMNETVVPDHRTKGRKI